MTSSPFSCRLARLLPILGLIPSLWAGQNPYQPLLPPEVNSESQGQALARQVHASVPEENARFTAILKSRSADGQYRRVPVACQIVVESNQWQTVYHTQPAEGSPAELLIIIHIPNQTNLYLHASGPSPLQPVPVTLAQADQPLAQSDFWLSDLGMEFLLWPDQRLIRTEMRKGRWCHVLESRNPHSAPGHYGRVLCWLDKEQGQPLLAEAYDHQDELLKEFSIGSIKKVNGQWQVQDMKISNVQTRSRTWLEFELE